MRRNLRTLEALLTGSRETVSPRPPCPTVDRTIILQPSLLLQLQLPRHSDATLVKDLRPPFLSAHPQNVAWPGFLQSD
jgi:hypothetical protein